MLSSTYPIIERVKKIRKEAVVARSFEITEVHFGEYRFGDKIQQNNYFIRLIFLSFTYNAREHGIVFDSVLV